MLKTLVVLMVLLVAMPVRAGIVTDLDSVEDTLIKEQKGKEQREIEDRERQRRDTERYEYKQVYTPPSDSISFKKPTSKFWLWTLAILAAAGGAAAAASSGGGGGSSGTSNNTGNTGGTGSGTVSW